MPNPQAGRISATLMLSTSVLAVKVSPRLR
jgi:hypothetical protein